MKIEEFETKYLYKIYELEMKEEKTNGKLLISILDQFTAFLNEKTNYLNSKSEFELNAVIDGIIEYFTVKKVKSVDNLSYDLTYVFHMFLALFTQSNKENLSVMEYLKINEDINYEISLRFEKLRLSSKEKTNPEELER